MVDQKRKVRIIAAAYTPFDESGRIALGKIETLAKWYRTSQVDGAFICGTTGEFPSITYKEKRALLKEWSKFKSPSFSLTFMVGSNAVSEMKELATLAEQYKYDSICMPPTFYFKPQNIGSLLELCREVASCSPSLPFYYYHIPSMTGVDFPMRHFLELLDERIPNFAGIKYSSQDIFDFQACVQFKNGKYNMLWGTDEALIAGLIAGANGAIGSSYNFATPLYKQIINHLNNFQLEEANSLQERSVQLFQILEKYGGAPAGKAVMKIIGIDCGPPRLPQKPVSDQQFVKLKSDLNKIGLFEFYKQIDTSITQ